MYPVPDTVSIKIKQISYPIRYPVSTLTKICIQSGIRSISKMCIQSGIRYPLCQRIVSNPVSCIHLSNKSYPIRYPVSTFMNLHLNIYLKKQAWFIAKILGAAIKLNTSIWCSNFGFKWETGIPCVDRLRISIKPWNHRKSGISWEKINLFREALKSVHVVQMLLSPVLNGFDEILIIEDGELHPQ